MRFAFLSITIFLIALGAGSADAETRVALVIGNGAYKHLPALKNPPNDARDFADALRRLDFDVDLGVDLRLSDMQEKVKAFARRAQTADVALAFFAGHGVQAPDPLGSARSVNYLLPTDVGDIREAGDLSFQITARDILARLQAARNVRILILDACRNNPIPQRLARSARMSTVARGLGAEPKTAGTLIAYSTQPDMTAEDGPDRNSPFMKALLAHIAEPGMDVRLVFTDVRSDVTAWTNGAQTPETSDSLNGRFMFRKADPAVATGPATAALVPAASASAPQVAVVAPPVTLAVRDAPHDVLLAYGGAYDDPKLHARLVGIASRLSAASDRPNLTYKVTILNSQAVDAFAFATGQLYVTRGLLALANDSAEVASAMSHEMAHVIARHRGNPGRGGEKDRDQQRQ